jgi:hypothetical protein
VDDTALAFPVHVASSRAQARAECEPGLLKGCLRPVRLQAAKARSMQVDVDVKRHPSSPRA